MRISVVALALLVTTVVGPATPAEAAPPDAMTIVRAMDREDGIAMTHVQDESPLVVVRGLCHELDRAGCARALHTKDAALLVFDTVSEARLYAGNADDDATALGRTVVSFGSPARVGPRRQEAYVDAVREYRESHPRFRNSLSRMAAYVQAAGLPMRTAWRERSAERAGLAASMPNVTDMVSTTQVDVLMFASRADAKDYVGAADDRARRVGRVVLSFGNPALLGEGRQDDYVAALRAVLE